MFDALVLQRREGMSPLLIEAILFLKENSHFWSIKDIREAFRRVRENEKTKRAEEKLQELNAQETNIAAEAHVLGIEQVLPPVTVNNNEDEA